MAANVLLYSSHFDCIRLKEITTLPSSLGLRKAQKVLHFIANIRQLLLSYTSTGVRVGIKPAPNSQTRSRL